MLRACSTGKRIYCKANDLKQFLSMSHQRINNIIARICVHFYDDTCFHVYNLLIKFEIYEKLLSHNLYMKGGNLECWFISMRMKNLSRKLWSLPFGLLLRVFGILNDDLSKCVIPKSESLKATAVKRTPNLSKSKKPHENSVDHVAKSKDAFDLKSQCRAPCSTNLSYMKCIKSWLPSHSQGFSNSSSGG